MFSGQFSANLLTFFVNCNHFSKNKWKKSAVTICAVARHVLGGKRYVAGTADAKKPYLEWKTIFVTENHIWNDEAQEMQTNQTRNVIQLLYDNFCFNK